MPRSAERRADVRNVVPGARSVIVTGTLYNTDRPYSTHELADRIVARISRYAWGDDYHDVLKRASTRCWRGCARRRPSRSRRARTSTPARCRSASTRSTPGLGWIGKNTCLINPEHRLLAVPRRDHLHARLDADTQGTRAVRQLHALPRRVSDRCARRTGRARFDAAACRT